MIVETALGKIFEGEKVTHAEGIQVRQALRWRPWWPPMESIAKNLRAAKGIGEGDLAAWRERDAANAMATLEPLYRKWREHRESLTG